jgi:SAM-dependent methyltransferase
MPDPIFSHPRLAQFYDAFDGVREDLPAYVAIASELGAQSVLDVGCGTGSLAKLLARSGFEVTAVEPAAASLAVARAKDDVDGITWIHTDAAGLPPLGADLAVMSGNVAQVFLTDDGWTAALSGVRRALQPRGYLAFETRRPERCEWEEWALRTAPVGHPVPGVGEVVQQFALLEVELPLVSFRYTYRFPDGGVVASDSTLRFRSRTETVVSLDAAGFDVVDVRDAPDRPGSEFVFIARVRDS